jgi:hypothetical protein
MQPILRAKNLTVSGCSFTQGSYLDGVPCGWLEFIGRKLNSDNLVNCALAGAGNYHIGQSIKWTIEVNEPDPAETFIIVMWSGMDRDDEIIMRSELTDTYSSKYYFTPEVATGITGGAHEFNMTNMNNLALKNLRTSKSLESRSIENYLYISSLYYYLKAKGYQFVFLNFVDPSLPSRTMNFDIKKYLPENLVKNLDQFIDPTIETIHTWCVKHDLLADDDFHPGRDGYKSWVDNVLFPYLTNNWNIV